MKARSIGSVLAVGVGAMDATAALFPGSQLDGPNGPLSWLVLPDTASAELHVAMWIFVGLVLGAAVKVLGTGIPWALGTDELRRPFVRYGLLFSGMALLGVLGSRVLWLPASYFYLDKAVLLMLSSVNVVVGWLHRRRDGPAGVATAGGFATNLVVCGTVVLWMKSEVSMYFLGSSIELVAVAVVAEAVVVALLLASMAVVRGSGGKGNHLGILGLVGVAFVASWLWRAASGPPPIRIALEFFCISPVLLVASVVFALRRPIDVD